MKRASRETVDGRCYDVVVVAELVTSSIGCRCSRLHQSTRMKALRLLPAPLLPMGASLLSSLSSSLASVSWSRHSVVGVRSCNVDSQSRAEIRVARPLTLSFLSPFPPSLSVFLSRGMIIGAPELITPTERVTISGTSNISSRRSGTNAPTALRHGFSAVLVARSPRSRGARPVFNPTIQAVRMNRASQRRKRRSALEFISSPTDPPSGTLSRPRFRQVPGRLSLATRRRGILSFGLRFARTC